MNHPATDLSVARQDAAHTLGAFRTCTQHPAHGVTYTAMLETPGPGAVAALVTAARNDGHLTDRLTGSVGVLDILDVDGHLIADHLIPTDTSWQWWVTAAGLRATATDCPTCDPHLWHRTDPTRRPAPVIEGDPS